MPRLRAAALLVGCCWRRWRMSASSTRARMRASGSLRKAGSAWRMRGARWWRWMRSPASTESTRRCTSLASSRTLHGRRRLADLVEEDGAVARRLEEPATVTLGAGERPAQVTEELALEERLGNGGAVLHQEGRLRARAAAVGGARQELLAGAGLTLE